jgi:hypothetical protein
MARTFGAFKVFFFKKKEKNREKSKRVSNIALLFEMKKKIVNDNAISRKQYNVFFDKICDFEENLTFFKKKYDAFREGIQLRKSIYQGLN